MPSENPGRPKLFLSHAGVDTEAARELKRRILESEAAKAAGLSVWFDKDDLIPGHTWQEQIERVITHEATAFAVYVGSSGVINWVEREVRLGLACATGANAIPFVPILAGAETGATSALLPPFARQHHAVRDPLNDRDEFAKLIATVLGAVGAAPPPIIAEPYVGLRAMTEKDADRFFGREAEVAELVDDLRRRRLVAIIADSGAGKSSLAMAGLVPAFRGGALADAGRSRPDDRVWHVVTMRPGADPLEGLRRGVTEAAERMGLSPEHRAGLRRRLTLDDPGEIAFALRCDLPADATETLLVVDQFDELLTQSPSEQRQAFVDLLTRLATMPAPGGFHVVLTVRVDYFNLCRSFELLHGALETDHSVLRLKRISDAGLEDAVRKPLRMAGYVNENEQQMLSRNIIHDLSDRPGDLALAQMALWTVWRGRLAHEGSLLRAYVDVGRVYGALAQEAELVRERRLNEAERAMLPALFVRLIRLGETGGVLRRSAVFEEFDDARLALARKLASDDHGRLLLVSEMSVEVCHEALITQWPWLQNCLNAMAADLRVLERLMDRCERWRGAPPEDRGKYLATGAERELYVDLANRHDEWLSAAEREFVTASEAAFATEQSRAREAQAQRARDAAAVRRALGWTRKWLAAALALGVTAAAVGGFAWREKGVADNNARTAREQREDADDVARLARRQMSEANDLAGDYLDSLLDFAPPAWGAYLHRRRAMAYDTAGNFVGERKQLDLALRLAPDFVPLLVSSSDNFVITGDADGAIRDATKAVAAGAPDLAAYGNLIIGEAMRRDYHAAIGHIDEATNLREHAQGATETLVAPDLRDFSNSFALDIPDSDFVLALRYLRAVLLAMQGDDGCAAAFRQADDADTDTLLSRTAYLGALNWEWLIVRGQARRDAAEHAPADVIRDYGAFAAEAMLWRRVAATRPDLGERAARAFAKFRDAHAAARQARYDGLAAWAASEMARAPETRPEAAPRLAEARDLEVRTIELLNGPNSGGDSYEMAPAVAMLTRAIHLLDPESPPRMRGRRENDALIDLLLRRAGLRLKAQDPVDARLDARRVIAIDPNVADAHRLIADTLADDAGKQAEYATALSLDPSNTDAIDGLAAIAERAGDGRRALDLLGRARRFRWFWSRDYAHLARLEDGLGDHAAAFASIGEAIAMAPGDHDYRATRHEIELHAGAGEAAAQFHYIQGLRDVAQFNERVGKDAAAVRAYAEAFHDAAALTDEPENRLARDTLARDFSAYLTERFGQEDAGSWWRSVANNPFATSNEKRMAAEAAKLVGANPLP